jgi:hypothetical protein
LKLPGGKKSATSPFRARSKEKQFDVPYSDTSDTKPESQSSAVIKNGEFGGVATDGPKTLPVEDGLPTLEIAKAFETVNGWNKERWTKNLSSSQWLRPARISQGSAGGKSSVWNPFRLAQLIHEETVGDKAKTQVMKTFYSRFNKTPALKPWRDAFQDYFATYCDEK